MFGERDTRRYLACRFREAESRPGDLRRCEKRLHRSLIRSWPITEHAMRANVRRGRRTPARRPRARNADYEELNVFGSPTGAIVHVREGDRLPPAPRSFTWSVRRGPEQHVPKENPARVWGPSRGKVSIGVTRLPESTGSFPYRKGERVSPAECAAKKSPAIAVTAMRGEVPLTIGNRPEVNCSGSRNVSSTHAAVNDRAARKDTPPAVSRNRQFCDCCGP
jgi:hypothetical protein